MPVTDTTREADAFTVVAEFPAPVERVWELWADPRKLERWWGPPEYPATFVRHDFTVPGKSIYYMTSPEGEQTDYAAWGFIEIEAPTRLEVDNGFSDADGNPAGELGWNRFSVRIEPTGAGARMTVRAGFGSPEHLEQLLGLGMLEGFLAALTQTDAILAEGA